MYVKGQRRTNIKGVRGHSDLSCSHLETKWEQDYSRARCQEVRTSKIKHLSRCSAIVTRRKQSKGEINHGTRVMGTAISRQHCAPITTSLLCLLGKKFSQGMTVLGHMNKNRNR